MTALLLEAMVQPLGDRPLGAALAGAAGAALFSFVRAVRVA